MDFLDKFCTKIDRYWYCAAIKAEGFSRASSPFSEDTLVLVTLVATSRNAMHLVISPGNFDAWILSVIYNSSRIQGQCLLWKEILGMTSLNLPGIIIGDFNDVVDLSEHKGGPNFYISHKACLFSDFISKNNLLDVSIIS